MALVRLIHQCSIQSANGTLTDHVTIRAAVFTDSPATVLLCLRTVLPTMRLCKPLVVISVRSCTRRVMPTVQPCKRRVLSTVRQFLQAVLTTVRPCKRKDPDHLATLFGNVPTYCAAFFMNSSNHFVTLFRNALTTVRLCQQTILPLCDRVCEHSHHCATLFAKRSYTCTPVSATGSTSDHLLYTCLSDIPLFRFRIVTLFRPLIPRHAC